jgi:hypothetical protein
VCWRRKENIISRGERKESPTPYIKYPYYLPITGEYIIPVIFADRRAALVGLAPILYQAVSLQKPPQGGFRIETAVAWPFRK